MLKHRDIQHRETWYGDESPSGVCLIGLWWSAMLTITPHIKSTATGTAGCHKFSWVWNDTILSYNTHTQRYTKLPLNAHRTSCSQGGFTVSTSHAAQTPSQCTSETVCVRRRAPLCISDLVLLNVYWVIWVAKHSSPDLKCNKIKLLIRESLSPLKINTSGASLIPKNVSKPKVWIYLGVNLVRKHLVPFLSWVGICLGCLNERQVVFLG